MKQVTRFFLGAIMLAALAVATLTPAPAAGEVGYTDGGMPTPWCRPSDPNCKP
jgi:hypothetical protein